VHEWLLTALLKAVVICAQGCGDKGLCSRSMGSRIGDRCSKSMICEQGLWVICVQGVIRCSSVVICEQGLVIGARSQ
jgi:hypothetical protein